MRVESRDQILDVSNSMPSDLAFALIREGAPEDKRRGRDSGCLALQTGPTAVMKNPCQEALRGSQGTS